MLVVNWIKISSYVWINSILTIEIGKNHKFYTTRISFSLSNKIIFVNSDTKFMFDFEHRKKKLTNSFQQYFPEFYSTQLWIFGYFSFLTTIIASEYCPNGSLEGTLCGWNSKRWLQVVICVYANTVTEPFCESLHIEIPNENGDRIFLSATRWHKFQRTL